MDRNFAFGEVEQANARVLKESRFANVFRKNELEDDKEENSALNKVKLKGVNVRVMKGTNFEDLKKDVSSVEKEWGVVIGKLANVCWQKAQKSKKNPYKSASDAKKDLKLQLVTYGKNKDGKFFGLEFAIGHPFNDKKTVRIIVDVDKSHKAQEPGNVTMEAFSQIIDMELKQAMYESVISQGLIVVTEDGNGKLTNIKNAIVGAIQAILKFLGKIFAGPIKKIKEIWAWIKKKYGNTIGSKFKEMAAAAKQKKPFSFIKPKAEHEAAMLESENSILSIDKFLQKEVTTYNFKEFAKNAERNCHVLKKIVLSGSDGGDHFLEGIYLYSPKVNGNDMCQLPDILDDNEVEQGDGFGGDHYKVLTYKDYEMDDMSIGKYIEYLADVDFSEEEKEVNDCIKVLEEFEKTVEDDFNKAKGKDNITKDDLKDFSLFSDKIKNMNTVSNTSNMYTDKLKKITKVIQLMIMEQSCITMAAKYVNDEKIRLMTEYARVSGMS